MRLLLVLLERLAFYIVRIILVGSIVESLLPFLNNSLQYNYINLESLENVDKKLYEFCKAFEYLYGKLKTAAHQI